MASFSASFEHSIWDCVEFYTIHTFLDPLIESQFRIISKFYNFLFGTTKTPSLIVTSSQVRVSMPLPLLLCCISGLGPEGLQQFYFILYCWVNLGWVANKIANGSHLLIVRIGPDPLILRGKPSANCAIDKCLYGSSGDSKLIWQEELSICTSKVHQVSMYLLK